MQKIYKKTNENTILAPFIIVAKIEYQENGKKIREGTMLVGRAETRLDAVKYGNKLFYNYKDIHNGYDGTELTYNRKKINRLPLTFVQNGRTITEVIKSVDIFTKEEYAKFTN